MMIFKAIACDYDGTLALENRIAPEALAALEQVRQAGVRLILVTGRTLFGLTRACECLDFFDAVVAENGGVLYFPGLGMIRDLGPPPAGRLLVELDRRGISFEAGRVVVGTWRGDEEKVRDALGAANVSLEIVYNRAALMLVPAGVSKGEGVRQVVREFGLSFHDVLAIGDAENDLGLFEACGWTACPENAVPALKERADWVFPGENGVAVAAALAGPVLGGLLPPSARHRIMLGWAAETSEPVTVPARGVNVLIQGDSFSGKSWLAGGLIERLYGRRYATCVIDPEGDFRVLGRLPGVTWVEVRQGSSWEGLLSPLNRDSSACLIADLSCLPHAEKLESIEQGFRLIREFRERLGLPHWVVLDEAHYSLHRDGVEERAIGMGEKGFCLVTYKPSLIRPSVLKAMDILILGRTTAPGELKSLRASLPGGREADAIAVLPGLPRGEFVLIEPAGTGDRAPLTFVAAPRETRHVRHLMKYADVPLPAERRFFFRHPTGRLAAAAGSLNEFRDIVATVEDGVLEYHAGRNDFSRWLLDLFSDRELGAQLRKIETRWSRGETPDLRQAIARLIRERYGAAR